MVAKMNWLPVAAHITLALALALILILNPFPKKADAQINHASPPNPVGKCVFLLAYQTISKLHHPANEYEKHGAISSLLAGH